MHHSKNTASSVSCVDRFAPVRTAQEILNLYGDASMFVAGLIVDGKHAFAGDLFTACATAMKFGVRGPSGSLMAKQQCVTAHELRGVKDVLQRDWVRRFHNFAVNYLGGDLRKTEACVTDSYHLHRWATTQRTLKANFADVLQAPRKSSKPPKDCESQERETA